MQGRRARRRGTPPALALALAVLLALAAAPACAAVAAGADVPAATASAAAPDLAARAHSVRSGGRLTIDRVAGLGLGLAGGGAAASASSASAGGSGSTGERGSTGAGASLELQRYEPFAPGAKVVVQVRPAGARAVNGWAVPSCVCGPMHASPPCTCGAQACATRGLAAPACPPLQPLASPLALQRARAPAELTLPAPAPTPPPPRQADPRSPPLERDPPATAFFRGQVAGSPDSQVRAARLPSFALVQQQPRLHLGAAQPGLWGGGRPGLAGGGG